MPSESEWEFAAQGGILGKGYEYSGGDKLEEVGWFNGNSKGKPHPIGGLAPNELGIFDMSGNVWEWCEDIWSNKVQEVPLEVNLMPGVVINRVIRGGSWYDPAGYCKVGKRDLWRSDYRNGYVGFRLAHSL